ncbi:hypothetical protein BaRGS_00033798, partial [Batillaria attramentaria]
MVKRVDWLAGRRTDGSGWGRKAGEFTRGSNSVCRLVGVRSLDGTAGVDTPHHPASISSTACYHRQSIVPFNANVNVVPEILPHYRDSVELPCLTLHPPKGQARPRGNLMLCELSFECFLDGWHCGGRCVGGTGDG